MFDRPMCGIAGIAGEGAEDLREELARGIAELHARGPEATGFHFTKNAALAHARLRIIDLNPRANQPMANEAGDVWLVFNGEIYDFAATRAGLAATGHTFRSETDSEVILHGYEERGADVSSELDGMFAFAIWDERGETQGSLLLARDRPGKKPLFWALHEGRLYFASEPKALFAMGVPREVDQESLPDLLVSGYVPAPRTPYRGVQQLPPASTLEWSPKGGAPRIRRYWALEYRPEAISLERAKDELRSLVRRAVERRMVADVPLGAFLSGGIDSTIVVGLMAQASSRPVRTFALGFEGDPEYDETHFAEIAAKRFRTDHTRYVVRPDAVELLPELVRLHDGPFGDSTAIPTYIISKLARRDVTVVMTGDGGDELFAGYQRFARGELLERVPEAVRKLACTTASWMPERPLSNARLASARRFLIRAGEPLGERLLRWNSYFPADDGLLLDRDLLADRYRRARDFHLKWYEDVRATPLGRMLKHNFEGYLAYDLLPKTDRMTMAHALEARSPLLDTKLMELAARLPDHFQMRWGKKKWLFKETFRDLLPEPIMKRGKMGFGMPLHRWFRGSLQSYVGDHLLAQGARVHGYFRREAIERLVQAHLQGRDRHESRIWLLLTFEIWLRSLETPATKTKAQAQAHAA